MTRLNMTKECQDHFYPTESTKLTEVATQPLTLFSLSGIFTLYLALCILSVTALSLEKLMARKQKRKKISYENEDQKMAIDLALCLHFPCNEDRVTFVSQFCQLLLVCNASVLSKKPIFSSSTNL
jgi:hypothetical protein